MSTNDPNRVVRCDISESMEEIAAFWTEERMMAARVVSRDVRSKAGGRHGGGTKPQVQPATLDAVSDVTAFPYSAVGKLFFAYGPDEEPSVGTAWIVDEYVIATVGHNVGQWDDGVGEPQWSRHMMFCPQYTGGQFPLGAYAMQTYFTLYGWFYPSGDEYDYDLAMCVTVDPLPLDKTQKLMFAANVATPGGTPVLAIGYPGAPEYQGFMYESKGQLLSDTGSEGQSRASNQLKTGASGGPWVITQSNDRVVIGTNSMEDEAGDRWSSPYFGDGMNALWEEARA